MQRIEFVATYQRQTGPITLDAKTLGNNHADAIREGLERWGREGWWLISMTHAVGAGVRESYLVLGHKGD